MLRARAFVTRHFLELPQALCKALQGAAALSSPRCGVKLLWVLSEAPQGRTELFETLL